jgi:hypothetical protein
MRGTEWSAVALESHVTPLSMVLAAREIVRRCFNTERSRGRYEH